MSVPAFLVKMYISFPAPPDKQLLPFAVNKISSPSPPDKILFSSVPFK